MEQYVHFIGNEIGALCKAANGNGNIAEVAARVQMDMHTLQKAVDYLKWFGRESTCIAMVVITPMIIS